jgi:hypothetical protein
MNIQQENQKVNNRSFRARGRESVPLGSVSNGASEGFFNLASMAAGGLSSFPAGGQAETSAGVFRRSRIAPAEVDHVYRLNPDDRLRVPGDDDEGPFPVRSLAIFDEDPFENAGAQVEIELDAAPYLDLYALNRGVGENDQKVNSQELSIEKLYDLEFNRFRACGHTSAMGSTEDFEDYLLPVDCRKAWCEKCGGKGGKVHKARKKAVRDRIDIEEKNLRYSVFTVPEKYREKFKSAKGLNQLIKGVERVVKKYYGEKKGFSVTVHLYG